MKRAATPWTLNVGRRTLQSGVFIVVLTSVFSTFALVAENPYGSIVERNVFALKPPAPPVVVAPPAAPPANIELRGITTLLGRPQVLLNFRLPGKPPEPPKDRSLVMDIGQREGDVEVLEINPGSGVVRLKNQGNEVSMNLKDNAPKPQFTASAGVPGILPAPGVAPAVPSPAAPGAVPAAPGGSGVTPFGGGTASPGATPTARPALPSRNLRSGTTGTDAASGNNVQTLSLEAQHALIEVERERTKEAVAAGKMPPIPTLNMPK